MKKFKRITAMLLCAVMVFSSINIAIAEEEFEEIVVDGINLEERIARAEKLGHRYAYFTFEQGQLIGHNSLVRCSQYNTSKAPVQSLDRFNIITHQGRSALNPTGKGAEASTLWIYPQGDYWKDSEPSKRFSVTIEYIDVAKASLDLHYPTSYAGLGKPENVYLETLRGQGTNEWKTITYYLNDCDWSRGSGFRIRIPSMVPLQQIPNNIPIGVVFIEENNAPGFLDVDGSNGYAGRMYSYGDSDEMKITYENTTNTNVVANASYKVRNYEGRVVYEGALDEIKLDAGIAGEQIIKTGVTERGTYTLEMTVNEKADNEENSWVKNIRFAIMDTLEEGEERNDLVAWCTGLSDTVTNGGYLGAEQSTRLPISAVRLGGLSADVVEATAGKYTDPTLNDRKYFSENGVETYAIAYYINGAYNGNRARNIMPNTKEAHEGFANYAAYVASLPYLDTVEIYNEWNHSGFSPLDQSADGYLEYLKVAYPKIKEAAKNAGKEIKVLAGGSAGFAASWLERFIMLGGLDYCDGLSYHPYQYKDFNYKTFNEQTEKVTGWMMKYHGSTKPITLTEMGMPEADDEETTNAGYEHWGKMMDIAGMYISAQYSGAYEKIYYFSKERSGSDDDQREPGFGLFEFAGDTEGNRLVPLDAAVTFATYMDKLTGATAGRKIVDEEFISMAYEFTKKDGKKIAALWTSKTHDRTAINLGCNEIEVFDQFGNLIDTMYSESGIFNFDLADEIIYIEGNFVNFEKAENEISLSEGVIDALVGDAIEITLNDTKGRNYRMEIDCDEEVFSIDDQGNMVNGTAGFVAYLAEGKMGRYHIEIKLFDENGRMVYVSRPAVEIGTEILSVEIDTSAASNRDTLRWTVNVTMKNLSRTKNISGECKILEPVEWTSKSRTFTDVLPNEERMVKINLPAMVLKRPQDLKIEVTLDSGIVKTYEQSLDFTTAEYADVKPVIDGKVSKGEWTGAVLCEDRYENYTTLIKEQPWAGVQDLSVTHQVMWDEDNFYMMAKVRDDVFSQSQTDMSMLWSDDSIQFGILVDNKETLDAQSLAFTEMCVSLTPNGGVCYRHSSAAGQPTGVVENTEIVITHAGGYTIYEMRLPWSTLFNPDHKAKAGDTYAFSFLVNDNDGRGRKGAISYNEGIVGDKLPNLFGRLTLNEKIQ